MKNFKGQSHNILCFRFFHQSSSSCFYSRKAMSISNVMHFSRSYSPLFDIYCQNQLQTSFKPLLHPLTLSPVAVKRRDIKA